MIVLDTNVVSELLRRAPDIRIVAWVDALPIAGTALTAVTVGELAYGVARLPHGRRRSELAAAIRDVVADDFRGHVEPYDADAAIVYADVVTGRERTGRPISTPDAQIAAICRTRGATLATRNVRDFDGTGVDVVNPWA